MGLAAARTIIALAAVGLSGCALFGLGIGFDEKSGDDASRGGAVELALDAPVDDRVTAYEGDHTDWRVFELVQPTKVTIRVWWDDPDDLDATLKLRGMSASQSRSISHQDGRRIEKIGPLNLPKGKWFVRVQATSGATVYTLEVQTSSGGDTGGSSQLPDF